MCIKRIALSFVLFVLIAFAFSVNTANAEETNTTDIDQTISDTDIPVQISFLVDSETAVPNNEEPVITMATEQTVSYDAEQTGSSTEKIEDNADADDSDESASDESEKSSRKKSSKKDKKKYTKAELRLMATIIYCEAGNESYAGKLAVGIVVMNRKESKGFANTVKGVIYQRGQFSPTWNGTLKRALARYDSGKFNTKAEKQCIKAAKAALSGEKSVTVKGKTKNFGNYYYFSGSLSNAKYRIGCHAFK